MPDYQVTIAGKTYNVEVPNPRERPARAIVDGEAVEVWLDENAGAVSAPQPVISAPAMAPIPVVAPAPTAAAAGDVTAPLPGVIISIAVKVGDRVTVGQELCVLEAMKMNNPIRSTVSGTVTAVHISVGQQIPHGAPLLTLGA